MTARIDVVLADSTVHNLDRCVTYGVAGSGGLVQVPPKRGQDLVIPGMHGQLHVWAKKYQPGTVVLPMWVRGVNADGTVPVSGDPGARLQYHQNLRQLIAWFTVDEQVKIRHTLSDGSTREITGEVLDVIEPSQRGAGRDTIATLAVALSCPDPFWTDLADVTATVPSTGALTTLTQFAGATAPMEDLVIDLVGPLTNPRVTQDLTGVFVQVNRVIPSGQTVTVDTGAWQVFGSGVGLYEDLAYGGRGTTRWFALRPGPGEQAPSVRLTTTGGTGTAVITGRRRYLIG